MAERVPPRVPAPDHAAAQAARADNFYYPPDHDPSKGSITKVRDGWQGGETEGAQELSMR